MLISLIAPAYNEEGNIAPFARSAAAAFSDLPEGWACELVFVDDGSRDCTLRAMHEVLEDASVAKSGLMVSVVEFLRATSAKRRRFMRVLSMPKAIFAC